MNKLPTAKRCQVISALVEGCSIRSIVRMTGVAKNTIVKLLEDVGAACPEYQDKAMHGLQCRRLEMDEIWAFCYAKAKNVPADKKGHFGYGDVWTFVAIDADTKLVPAWLHGNRDACDAKSFVQNVADRLVNRVQVTTDGHKMYLEAMESAFAGDVDYAMLVKVYGNEGNKKNPETKYSPGECCGTEKNVITGNPERDKISTSYIERQNLTMRMRMRRFTRLTNAFSKKLENFKAAIGLNFAYYNFVKNHSAIRCTPAMAAGVMPSAMTVRELVELAHD